MELVAKKGVLQKICVIGKKAATILVILLIIR